MLPQSVIRSLGSPLKEENHEVTSPVCGGYNCFAWAAEIVLTRWDPYNGWWPDYMEEGDCSKEAFIKVYSIELGYVECGKDNSYDPSIQKIAIYLDRRNEVSHVARQLTGGKWASKIGDCHDIVHNTEFDVEGWLYGSVDCYMMRPRIGADPIPPSSTRIPPQQICD